MTVVVTTIRSWENRHVILK